jgi:hypothetical protein
MEDFNNKDNMNGEFENNLDESNLVFSNHKNESQYGGFSVNSILNLNKSPIKTVILPENENDEQTGGKKEKKLVSELFSNIVIPNWALCYDNPLHYFKYDDTKDDDDEVIEDDLHNKLLDLVKHSNKNNKNNKNKFTKRKREKNKNKGKKTKKYEKY